MPIPEKLKRFLIGNSALSFSTPIIQMTLLWLIYKEIQNPLLFIPIASARPISQVLISPLAGYVSDKFDRRKANFILGIFARLSSLTVVIFLIFHSILFIIFFFILRVIFSMFSVMIGSVAFYQIVPREMQKQAIFINRIVYESSEIAGTISWYFLLSYLGVFTAILGLIISMIGGIIFYTFQMGGGHENVSLSSGFKLFKEKNVLRLTTFGTASIQGAIWMIVSYAPALIIIYHGTSLIYDISQVIFSLSFIIGSWIMKRFKSVLKIITYTLPIYFSIFILMIIHNPWIVVYGLGAIGIADSIYEIYWLRGMQNGAGEELLGSAIGVDEFVTAISRLSFSLLAGYLYTTVMLLVPFSGLLTMSAVTLWYIKNINILKKISID